LAIGNPFGVGQTVASGIISALGRSGFIANKYEDFIQTDAAINPGNSGGPLVNSKGELVGISTALIAPSGGNVGIGFAIPANLVKAVVNQLDTFEIVGAGRIGITVQSVTPDVASKVRVSQSTGAIVRSVEGDSPGQRAGLKVGDVVIEIDGSPVLSASDLRNYVGLSAGGTEVAITYLRGEKQYKVTASIISPTIVIRREHQHWLGGQQVTGAVDPRCKHHSLDDPRAALRCSCSDAGHETVEQHQQAHALLRARRGVYSCCSCHFVTSVDPVAMRPWQKPWGGTPSALLNLLDMF
jgi:hypothetical protein